MLLPIIICSFHLFVVTTLYDKLVGRFLRSSGLVTESGLAPRGNRAGSADGGLAFAAAVGVIAGVHDRTADRRSPTHVTFTAGLTDFDVFMVEVTDLTDGSHAGSGDVAKLA